MKFRVPATTGNTGPGFDSVGLAFTLYARFEAELLPAGQLAISAARRNIRTKKTSPCRPSAPWKSASASGPRA